MIRFRRYRVFLVFAFLIILLLFQVSKNSSRWEPPGPSPYEASHWSSGSAHGAQYDPPADARPNHSVEEDNAAVVLGPQPKEDQIIKIPELKTSSEVKGGFALPTPIEKPTAVETTVPGSNDTVPATEEGQHGGIHIQNPPAAFEDPASPTETVIRWHRVPEHFPVPEESLIQLPTGKPKPIPTVQFDFERESETAKAKREARLAKVKTEAARAWSGYKKYAWTHDEVMPVSQGFKDPFCGWAATLVDTLDTLWIMGMKDEFDDAIQAVKTLDFTTTPHRADIPVFETVIRYLGGLLAAYDVSGGHSGKYRILLDKAVELAEILMGAFDTPNRMPVLYYGWHPASASQPHRASTSACVAELGSLSMEFTRLAQLTGENKYYDAVARITDAFEELQNAGTSAIPGIFPERIDASGCNRTATTMDTFYSSSKAARVQAEAAEDVSDSSGYTPKMSQRDEAPRKQADDKKNTESQVKRGSRRGDLGIGDLHQSGKRAPVSTGGLADNPVTASGLPADWDCVPQGLTASLGQESYSMGGSQDSTYEYLPKQFMLLGGLEPKYRTMHEKVSKAVKEHLLYRPMTKDNQDILFSAKAYARPGSDEFTFEYEVTHLTCFLGGMFALGGKIFENKEDVEAGKLLAAGCAWAYEVFPTGIMPEGSVVVPCQDAIECRWNETLWWDFLDTNAQWREVEMRDYLRRKKVWEQEMEEFKKDAALRAQAEEEAKKQEVLKKQGELRDDSKSSSASDRAAADRGLDDTAPSVDKRAISVDSEEALEAASAGPIEDKVKALEAELDLNSVTAHQTHSNVEQTSFDQLRMPQEPYKPATHEEYVANRITAERLPPGFVRFMDRRYILRPEAIESVWYMYRITGDPSWQERGWKMFEAVIAATQTPIGHSAIDDVTMPTEPMQLDYMESFWLAETLKYFYLLFSTPDVISLDEWVLNTEAHPFKLAR